MLHYYPQLTLFRGATSVHTFDFSTFDFLSGEVVLTIRNKNTDATIYSCTFDEAREYNIEIPTTISETLEVGNFYEYDLMLVVGNNRYPQCRTSPVSVKRVTGYAD